MKKEDLFDAIGEIRDETVAKSALGTEKNGTQKNGTQKNGTKGRLPAFSHWSALAAAVVVLLVAGSLFYLGQTRGVRKSDTGDENATGVLGADEDDTACDAGGDPTVDGTAGAGEPGNVENAATTESSGDEKYVNIYSLFPVENGTVYTEDVAYNTQVPVDGGYTALYEKCSQVLSEDLQDCLGRALEGAEGWYRVSGHEELQFLICKEGDAYSLWVFRYFLAEEYPYRDVLKIIYDMGGAEGLQAIVVSPANMDNTDEGKKLQEEIGTRTISDPEDLEALYDILFHMTCYGGNHWEMIDYGAADDHMLHSVLAGRYLDLFTGNDFIIGGLKYTAVSGMFYEYGGVAYNRLSEEDKQTVERILGIDYSPRTASEQIAKILNARSGNADSEVAPDAADSGPATDDATDDDTDDSAADSNAILEHDVPREEQAADKNPKTDTEEAQIETEIQTESETQTDTDD